MQTAHELDAVREVGTVDRLATKGAQEGSHAGDGIEAVSHEGTGNVANVDSRKFTHYIFKDGATHGKDTVFRSLGYDKSSSKKLIKIYQEQATQKLQSGDFSLGKFDEYGQRINIGIDLPGIGGAAGKVSYLKSGWMIKSDGSITLNTPFAGFMR